MVDMNKASKTVSIALGILALFAPITHAQTDLPVGVESCSVNEQQPTCMFVCLPNEYLIVALENPGPPSSTITANCGTADASCTAHYVFQVQTGCTAASSTVTLLPGVGTCTLSDAGGSTTGFCATATVQPPSCTVMVTIIPDDPMLYVTEDYEFWLESNGLSGLQCTGTNPDTQICLGCIL